jgi:hypothetical protein
VRGRQHSRALVLGGMTGAEKPAEPSSRGWAGGEYTQRAPTSAAARTTIDTIVNSSTVELFSAYRLAVAPLGSSLLGSQQRYYDCVGLISFDTPRFVGTLTLSVSNAVYDAQSAPGALSDRTMQADWTQEMVNQLLGRIKNRLTMFQMSIKMRLPSTMSGVALDRLRKRSPSETLYRFRALRGDILVTLDAPFDNASLTYSGTNHVVKEGDVILF